MEDSFIFYMIRAFIFWCSPVIFFVGILLVLYGNYKKLENQLAKVVGGIPKKILPKLEDNIYTFHEWLLEKNTLIGLICVISSLLFFFILR